MPFNVSDVTGSNFSVQGCFSNALNLLDETKKGVSKEIDQVKTQKARVFLIKNERTILFSVSIGVTFFMSPRLLIVGSVIGAYLKIKFYDDPWMKKLDPDDRILSIFETFIVALGATGTLFRSMYPRTVLELSPLLAGIGLGSVFFDIYIRSSERLFSHTRSSSEGGE